MTKFHVNPETGEVDKCTATKACRFGSSELHGNSREEAVSAYELFVSQDDDPETNLVSTFTKKDKSKAESPRKESTEKSSKTEPAPAPEKRPVAGGADRIDRWHRNLLQTPGQRIAISKNALKTMKKAAEDEVFMDYLAAKKVPLADYLNRQVVSYAATSMEQRITADIAKAHAIFARATGKKFPELTRTERQAKKNVALLSDPQMPGRLTITSRARQEAAIKKEILAAQQTFEAKATEFEATGDPYPLRSAAAFLAASTKPNDRGSSFDADNAFAAAVIYPENSDINLMAIDGKYHAALNEMYPNRALPDELKG